MKETTKMNLQLYLGFALALFGMIMLTMSFFVPPMGVIDPSVLAVIGEVFTFSGALIGIDYHYKYKLYQRQDETNEE